jgi:hypothetical protein
MVGHDQPPATAGSGAKACYMPARVRVFLDALESLVRENDGQPLRISPLKNH